jgi:hypothetical protein
VKDAVWNGAWHSLAERFPMLTEEELREMAASIAERGQYVPCRMTPDGLGLDGRNRVAACALAGTEPQWEVYEGDPVAFIVEVNAERRHLSTGQRAMAVAIGLVAAGARSNGKFAYGSKRDESGRASRSAWGKALGQAGTVLDHASELADGVLDGSTALDAAYKVADDRRKAADRVRDLGGELAALVETGVIDVDEAERRADEERRLAALDDDLAARVRDGMALDEGEAAQAQRQERNAKWVADVDRALDLLVPMVGGPLPDLFKDNLSPEKYARLTAALQVWKRQKGQNE